jgi:hypothetical protein
MDFFFSANLLIGDGQLDPKRTAFARCAVHPHLSAVRFNYRFDQK